MSGELAIIVAFCVSPLFALGGTEIPAFKRGFKWLRREVLPVLWALLAFSAGFEWWRCIAFAIAQDIVFRLPYGDRTPTWVKLLVFLTYPLPSLLFGFDIWQAYCGALCFMLFVLSNWKPTARAFEWVVSCLLIGAFLGVTIGKLIVKMF
jgi:hypothetical protein